MTQLLAQNEENRKEQQRDEDATRERTELLERERRQLEEELGKREEAEKRAKEVEDELERVRQAAEEDKVGGGPGRGQEGLEVPRRGNDLVGGEEEPPGDEPGHPPRTAGPIETGEPTTAEVGFGPRRRVHSSLSVK